MLELRNLQKVHNQQTVVDIASLRIENCEVAGLISPVGGNRQALLELLVGQSQPSRGEVRIGGVDPRGDKARFSRQAGVLFAEDGLYRNQSTMDNLLFQCRLYGLPRERAEESLALVGLADQTKTQAGKLDPGLARRLAFARSIVHSPTDLIMEEPFARCDEASIQVIGDLIRQLAAGGVAGLILADDSSRLANLCATLYLFTHGKIEEFTRAPTEPDAGRPFKIPVKLEGRVALINPGDILYAEAEGDTACLQTIEGRLPTQFTLAELEARLVRSGFFRAHRAYLVNLQHVREVIPFTRNSFSLRLDDPAGTQIPLSKSAAAELRGLLDY